MAAGTTSIAPSGTDEFLAPFWSGLAAGELRVQRCAACGMWRWTPQACCPRCLDERYRWEPTTGRGAVYSYTRVHHSPDPARFPAPYLLGIVELDEGIHLLTTLQLDELRPAIGMRVRVRPTATPDGHWTYPFGPDP